MSGRTIYLFMWGYQDSYRISIQSLARDVLSKLGVMDDAYALLVGARAPGSSNSNPVCVEPEDGQWPLALFEGLLDDVESKYKGHRLQTMFFSDNASMNDKPEWMRRDSATMAVANALKSYDKANEVKSYCGQSRLIGEYYVVPVIQVPTSIFTQFPPLSPRPVETSERSYGYRSLIDAAIYAVLEVATGKLQDPEPGRFFHDGVRSAEEIVRLAAEKFMHTPGLSIRKRYIDTGLLKTLNLVSSLLYEGSKGIGDLVIVDPTNTAVDFALKFTSPVPLREPRWVRKVLQMAATGIGIITDSESIYGLGRLKESHDPAEQDAFIVSFIDHYHWELRCGEQMLIRSHYGVPRLPQEPFDKIAFLTSYSRIFPRSLPEDGLHAWSLLKAQTHLQHGSMIVFAEDAASEAERLGRQGTPITPTILTEELLQSVSNIDGTIIVDPRGYCHAVGVILDGNASEDCMPSRGSRYNSGVRYVGPEGRKRLAIIVSDDRTIDIIPALRRLVSRTLIERHIATLESAKLDNYHDSRHWLDKHRFYITPEQCERINTVLSHLDSLPREVGLLYFEIDRFEAHPDMDESYLVG
ncbi:hypothetical protein [Pseudomonas sp. UFMG81]|uniref:hypothetical protein n=1 Tax=Pseudomonas sp. UFMG81 TaxID=2745936 RepID=UPI0018904D08|nr:hypothetical protein [Pseudomonas sp. UFMG81]